MKLNDLQNKKIGILGLGIENYALVKFLLKNKIKAEITVCDARAPERLGDKFVELIRRKNIKWQLGKSYNRNLYKFDILFRSPGWPILCPGIQEAIKVPLGRGGRRVILSSPMKLFFDLCPAKNIIGVTGTKGKGTTASLIQGILQTAKKKSWLGGNIGVAPFAFLPKIKNNDWVILELSSFQLEDMDKSPHIAVVTNLYSEHLAPADPHNPNYHKTLKDYRNAKMNITRWHKKGDYVIVNSKFKNQKSKLQFKNQKYLSKIVYFGKSGLKSRLIGEHNKENIAAAVEVAKIIGIKKEIIAKAVKNFKGLEHRLEMVREIRGVKYYNDSFATTPEATITALKSFQEPIVILAGGADKGANFKSLAKEIKKHCRFAVLLYGQATPRLKKELLKAGFPGVKMKLEKNIRNAMSAAVKNVISGDVVLLSTACASFGMFKNYKERGRLFKEEVEKIK